MFSILYLFVHGVFFLLQDWLPGIFRSFGQLILDLCLSLSKTSIFLFFFKNLSLMVIIFLAVVRWNAFEKYYVLKVRKRIKWVYSKLNIFCARFMYVHVHCSACLDKISIHNKYFIYIICLNGWRRSQIYVPWTSLEKFQFFLVSIHFLCRGSTYWYSNDIWYTDLS